MIGDAVRAGLKRDGFTVDWVRDGDAADTALATGAFDLLLLDLGLPRRDGIAVLRRLREKGGALPVLILTARDGIHDRVAGLDAGADDYLVKPFDIAELSARVRALLRRRAGRADAVIEHLGVRVNPATREVAKDGAAVTLSPREYALLLALVDRPGAIMSRSQLEERLYGYEGEVESNAVEVHIHGLRKKLGAGFVRNVRGVGWYVPAA